MIGRRQFITGSLAIGATPALGTLGGCGRGGGDADESPSPMYAETAAIFGVSSDGSREVQLRIGRFPAKGVGTIWSSFYIGDEAYTMAAEGLDLAGETGVTPAEEDRASFRVGGEATARVWRNGGLSVVAGRAEAGLMMRRAHHPPLGSGTVPVEFEAEFECWHDAHRPRPGRLELMGDVRARLKTPEGDHRIDLIGGWHEQVGNRPRFAPAFTYFKIFGDRMGVLASRRVDSAWGYAYLDDRITAVESFVIDPPGANRAFRIGLADGRSIEGEANVVREHSVPVEGQRRPGTTVLADSNVGPMVGRLNDWNPEDG